MRGQQLNPGILMTNVGSAGHVRSFLPCSICTVWESDEWSSFVITEPCEVDCGTQAGNGDMVNNADQKK